MSRANELLTTSIGLGGSQLVKDTARYLGKWKIFTALTDCVIDEYTDSFMTGDLSGVTIKQGDSIGGNITVVKLTSGTALLYE